MISHYEITDEELDGRKPISPIDKQPLKGNKDLILTEDMGSIDTTTELFKMKEWINGLAKASEEELSETFLGKGILYDEQRLERMKDLQKSFREENGYTLYDMLKDNSELFDFMGAYLENSFENTVVFYVVNGADEAYTYYLNDPENAMKDVYQEDIDETYFEAL